MARVLALAGATLPQDLIPAGRGNVAGHWEPIHVANFNDQILQSLDTSWDGMFPPRRNRRGSLVLSRYLSEAQQIIQEQYSNNQLIVIKEPRITLLVDFWGDVLTRLGYECAYVVMVRRPQEVAASLMTRDQIEQTHALLQWATYMSQADLRTRGKRRIFCSYDRLLSAPNEILDEIEDRLGVEFPRRTAKSSLEIRNFVTPALRNHKSDVADEIPPLLYNVRALAEYCFQLCSGDLPNDDVSKVAEDWLKDLDGIISPILLNEREKFEAEAAINRSLQEALVQAQQRASEKAMENDDLRNSLARADAASTELEARVSAWSSASVSNEMECEALKRHVEEARVAAAVQVADWERRLLDSETRHHATSELLRNALGDLTSIRAQLDVEKAARRAEAEGREVAERAFHSTNAQLEATESARVIAEQTLQREIEGLQDLLKAAEAESLETQADVKNTKAEWIYKEHILLTRISVDENLLGVADDKYNVLHRELDSLLSDRTTLRQLLHEAERQKESSVAGRETSEAALGRSRIEVSAANAKARRAEADVAEAQQKRTQADTEIARLRRLTENYSDELTEYRRISALALAKSDAAAQNSLELAADKAELSVKNQILEAENIQLYTLYRLGLSPSVSRFRKILSRLNTTLWGA